MNEAQTPLARNFREVGDALRIVAELDKKLVVILKRGDMCYEMYANGNLIIRHKYVNDLKAWVQDSENFYGVPVEVCVTSCRMN